MAGKNKDINHGYRKPGHYLSDCCTKKPFPVCGKGIEKCMEVEKKTKNLGRLFFCCTNECGHFKWLDEEEVWHFQGESSATSEEVELSSLLKNVAKITEEKDVDISVKFTFRKGK